MATPQVRVSVLEAFSRALSSESRSVSLRPDLTWQHLYNRLQFRGIAIEAVVRPELTRRMSPSAPPWFHRRNIYRESEALTKTLIGQTSPVGVLAVSPTGSYAVSSGAHPGVFVWDLGEGTLRRRHPVSASACVIAADGSFFVTASSSATEAQESETLRGFDPLTGRQLFGVNRGQLGTCALAPDGSYVISGGWDGSVAVHDTATGRERFRVVGHYGPVARCVSLPDGTRFASAGNDGRVVLWDAEQGVPTAAMTGHEGRVNACVVTPDGRTVVTAGDDGTVRVWSLAGKQVAVLEGHSRRVISCAVSPDATFAVSGGDDGAVRVWDLGSNAGARHVLTGHRRGVVACVVGSDGRFAVSGSADGDLRVWDVASGVEIGTWTGHTGPVRTMAIAGDDSVLISGSDDRTVKLWDPHRAEPSVDGGHSESPVVGGHSDRVVACVLSPDAHYAVSGSRDCTLRVWDAVDGLATAVFAGHSRWVTACAISPDGRFVVSGDEDGGLRVWEPHGRAEPRVLSGHQARITSCVWAPDGAFVLSASEDCSIRVWDPTGGEEQLRLEGLPGWVIACELAPDGSYAVASCDDGAVLQWDTATGKTRRWYGGSGRIQSIAISPDGSLVVTGDHTGEVLLWDAASGTKTRILAERDSEGWRGASACSVADDGSFGVAAQGPTLTIWNLPDGDRRGQLRGHDIGGVTLAVAGCVVSSDGSRLVSAGADGTVRLWSLDDGRQLAVARPGGAILCLDADRALSRVVAGDDAGSLHILDVEP